MKNKKPLPLREENPNGLHNRYILTKISGKPIHPEAEYFILRLDDKGDPKHIEACKQAAMHYAIRIRDYIPKLSRDLIERYSDNNTMIRKVSDMIKNEEECPLPLSVIPNNMGINLCSVDTISWHKQNDGQLTSLTIHFIPSEEKK